MKLVTFKDAGSLRPGARTEAGVLDIQAASTALHMPHLNHDPDTLIRQGTATMPALQELLNAALVHRHVSDWLRNADDLVLGPCVPNPRKIICVGLNYHSHTVEFGSAVPKTPILFSKFHNAIAATGDTIPLPLGAEQYDYEAELVVVIGREARDVLADDALDYVLGYCIGNDITARDLQRLTSQWLIGKSLDRFLPLGPDLVTADEIPDPQDLDIRCWLNGELRQNSNTAHMIFPVADLISFASRYMALLPGDIISTGTPEGVIMGMAEPVWMKPGDTVTIEISGLGRLTNTMA